MVQGSKGRIAFVAVDLKQDPMCDLLDAMPCANAKCKRWVYEGRIRWRQFDWHPYLRRRIDIEFVSFHDERWWFFFCERCLAEKPWLRGWYINADGHTSTDDEGS